jgi:transcriptional regulator with PAS, ATPase and Fis domain
MIAETKEHQMSKIEILTKQLGQAGKIEKFDLYSELLGEYYGLRDTGIFSCFDNYILLLEEYLSFDPKLEKRLSEVNSRNFNLVFSFIQNSGNSEAFEKYYPVFELYQALLPDNLYKAKIFQDISYFFWMKLDLNQCKKFLKTTLDIANEHCKPNQIPGRYTNLGYIYECIGELEKAEYYYQLGLDFAKKNSCESALILAYDAMGRLHLSRDNYGSAIQYFEESLKLQKQDMDFDKVAVINNLATAYMNIGEYKKAEGYYKMILTPGLKQANQELYHSVLVNSASNYRHMLNYKIAEEQLKDAIAYSEKHDAVEQLVACYVNLGTILLSTDRFSQAEHYLKKSEEIALETKNNKALLKTYRSYSELFLKQDEYDLSIKYLLKSYKLALKQDNAVTQANILKMLIACYVGKEDYKSAFNYQQDHIELEKRIMEENSKKEKEISENTLVGKGKHMQYIFKESNTMISNELAEQIGTNFVGRNKDMHKVITHAIIAASNADANVLIRGESGTGKEILARLIHFSSSRAKKPFVAVNSASFASGIYQSALFGHLKGAFTGASFKHIGHFEAANNGTLFLDEIGDMPFDIQSSLLRVLEEKVIQPLGSRKGISVDFRLISATNKNITEMAKTDSFRFDFLNRINTLELVIPPLRERKDDIPILIDYFIEDICSRLKIARPVITIAALKMLSDYDYPGNIRELKNTIEKLVLFSNNNQIGSEDIYLLQSDTPRNRLNDQFETLDLAQIEQLAVKKALIESNHVKTKAAELLGITPYSLLRRLKKYKLEG